MTSYFDVLSWTRARKNREALEKTNPQNPVLNEDDENFLQRITSQEAPAPPLPVIEPTVIDDDGVETEANATQKEAAEMILPSSPGEKNEHEEEKEDAENEGRQKRSWASYIPSVPSLPSLKSRKVDAKDGPKDESKKDEKKEDVKEGEEEAETEVKKEVDDKNPETETKPERERSDSAADNIEEAAKEDQASEEKPAQEETVKDKAEAARDTIQEIKEGLPGEDEDPSAFEAAVDQQANVEANDHTDIKVESNAEGKPDEEVKTETEEAEEGEAPTEKEKETSTEKEDEKTAHVQRTWASYIPAMPSLGRSAKGKEAEKEGEQAAAAIAAETQTAEAKEQDEREVSVLLDNLNLSAINNRVFSFSEHSQKIYGQFTTILRDMINGAPTAYEDLENLIKDNEKHLDQMFSNMPPFVQTLVKSLPAKFASSLGPEIMAAASDKPGNDLKRRMEVASKASSSAATAPNINFEAKKKQKKKVPGVKALATEKGAVTSMLTNIVNFLKVRFPAFVTGTNIVMSLAVFILLFVFWYCHKRGKETRLLRESESARASATVSEASDNEQEDLDEKTKDEATSSSSSSSEAENDEKKKEEEEDRVEKQGQKLNVGGPDNASAARAKKILEQSSSADVALPDKVESEKEVEKA